MLMTNHDVIMLIRNLAVARLCIAVSPESRRRRRLNSKRKRALRRDISYWTALLANPIAEYFDPDVEYIDPFEILV